jgi:hypothetical protein
MKQYVFVFLIVMSTTCAIGQEKPAIKQGTWLKYSVTVGGQSFPMFFQLDSLTKNYCGLTWNFQNSKSGRFVMRGSSLDSAFFGYWNQPIVGEELEIPATQGLLLFSRLLFSQLKKDGKANFDDYKIAVKKTAPSDILMVNNKVIDALYVESDGGAKIWILNNPITPLILKIEGNPFGVDVTISHIQ